MKNIRSKDLFARKASGRRRRNEKANPRRRVDSLWSTYTATADFSVDQCNSQIATWNIIMMQEAYINSTVHSYQVGSGLRESLSPRQMVVADKKDHNSFEPPSAARTEQFKNTNRNEGLDAIPTDVTALRNLFGRNRNSFWGDLDPPTCRRLYQALLPRTLLRLYREGLAAEELAPLAYEARVAAKVYARERSQVPGRIAAVAYDGFRHLWKYGVWSSKGLTWFELWDKYEAQIKEEVAEIDPSVREEDLTSKVCLRILERSCVTNSGVDCLLLSNSFVENELDRLDKEVEDILQEMQRPLSIYALKFKFLRRIIHLRWEMRDKFPK